MVNAKSEFKKNKGEVFKKACWSSMSVLTLILGLGLSALAEATPIRTQKVSIFHTNDLHSHYRPEKSLLGLGGVARLKTKMDQLRKDHPHSFLVDAGDWSEGNIYYVIGTGAASIQMMDHIGYDVAVIGNHDWLNGPDVLLDSIIDSKPKMQFVGANLAAEDYPRANEFSAHIQPYVIREMALDNGLKVKVAFVGISTYEFIYDRFLKPVQITNPHDVIPALAEHLKTKADIVVGISHNSIVSNEAILAAAPAMDLIIGGHDHKKLTKPVKVEREGAPDAWIVETGSWGHYIGQVDLEITAEKQVKLSHYRLHQLDRTIAEDKDTHARVLDLENKINKEFGSDVFNNHIGDCEFNVQRINFETPIGNLVTDAFLKAGKADVAIDSTRFIYGELHKGAVSTADAFNVYPGIYNPTTHKTWNLKTLPITGRLFKWLLYFLYATNKVSTMGILSASGVQFTYDPLFASNITDPELPGPPSTRRILAFESLVQQPQFAPESIPVVQNIRIQGEPLQLNKTYKLAISEGIAESFRFVNNHILNIIPLDKLEDTGEEQWRAVQDHIKDISPVTPEKLSIGTRIRSLQPDLAVYDHDISWEPLKVTPAGVVAKVNVKVRNNGVRTAEEGVKVHLYQNKNSADLGLTSEDLDLGPVSVLGEMESDKVTELTWTVTIPQHQGLYQVSVSIEKDSHELVTGNNKITKWFAL